MIDTLCARRAGRVAASTLRKYRHDWNRWLRSRTTNAEDFRTWGLENGLSTRTIESTLSTVRLVLELDTGEPLAHEQKRLNVPSIADIEAIYRNVDGTKWPKRIPKKLRPHWWRCFIGVACITGLRLGDLESLERDSIESQYLVVRANKTARVKRPDVAIPLSPELRPHLSAVPFLLTKSRHQLYRELKNIASTAGVPYVSPKRMRQFAITRWASADSMAGKLIQGCSLGVMGHYVDVGQFLASVAPRVEWPSCFSGKRDDSKRLEQELVAHYRRAGMEQRKALITIARSVA